MKEKTCFFTGHRNIAKKDYEKIYQLTKNSILFRIVNNDIKYFKVGGARGFDMIASLVIIELKKEFKDIKLILILPCKNQMNNWCKNDKDLYNIVLQNADEIIYISENYTKDCMLKRNDKLLEDSMFCICYLRKSAKMGGTFYTVNRAEKQNIKIYNINNIIEIK